MGTVIAKFLAGSVAGLLAWALMEPFKPNSINDMVAWTKWEGIFVLLFGALIGFVVGGYDGFSRGGKVHLLRGFGLGFLFGAIGGSLGNAMGAGIVRTVFGGGVFSEAHLSINAIFARTLVFVFLGTFVGAAVGGSSLNSKKLIQGAVGGAIGGGIGGVLFDIIGTILGSAILAAQNQTAGEVGGPSRAIAFTLMGGAIGLFIGLVERLTRSAWIRLTYGRNEYKEWSIDSAQTFIGRNESATIPLMGDPHVAPVHAVIQRQGKQYMISDGGSPVGTIVNGQFVQQAPLAPGSVIKIASFHLQFLVKGIPAPVYAMDGARQQPMTPQMQPFPNQPAPTFAASQPTMMTPPGFGNQTVAYGGQAPSLVGFSLVALDGSLASQRFPVTGTIEVGREAANIKLGGDTNASRRHASISPGQGSVRVMDLGSTNGTFVNGQRVTSADAKPGDVIKIGSTSFRVEAG